MNKIIQLIFPLLFVARISCAAEALSWQQCVDLALTHNSSLRSAIASEKSTHFLKNAAYSGFLPQVTGSLTSNRGTGGNTSNPSATTVQNSIVEAYNGSVTVSQNIFAGFSDIGRINQAEANNLVSKANIAIVKAQVSYDLRYAFANLTYAKETTKLLDDIIHRRQDNLRIIELRFKSGMENKGSVLLARAYLEQAQYDRLQAENLIETARAQLCRAIGLTKCDIEDVKGVVPTKEPPQKVDFRKSVEETPQHLQATAQERAAKSGITIAQSAFLPTLNVVATTGNRGPSYFPQNDYWSLGMNLSFAFFTGGRDYHTTRSAYANANAAKENREVADQQALVTLKQGYNSYIESVAKLKVDTSFRDVAKLRADIARNKYNNGLLIFEDWDIIETDLITRQKNYLQSKLNRVVNESAWQQAQGKGVFDDKV